MRLKLETADFEPPRRIEMPPQPFGHHAEKTLDDLRADVIGVLLTSLMFALTIGSSLSSLIGR